jgi:hypothetical protein
MNKTLVALLTAGSLFMGCDKKEPATFAVTSDAQTIQRYDALRDKHKDRLNRWHELDKELDAMLQKHSWPEKASGYTLWKLASDGSYVFPEDNNGKGAYMFTIAVRQNDQESRLKLVFGEDGEWLNKSSDKESAVNKYFLSGVISKLQNRIKE